MLATFSFPTTVVFGPQTIAQLRERLRSLGVSKPLVVTDRGFAATPGFASVMAALGGSLPVHADVHPNPLAEDADSAAAAFSANGCDAVVAVGGGSVLDVGKALRLRVKRPDMSFAVYDGSADWRGLAPLIAIPTTAGTGSEVGRASVLIVDGVKRIFFQPALLASLVILDPELTVGLPPRLTAATGADALTHCIESYTSPEFHPLCDGIALEGLHLIVDALPRAVRDGADLDARGRMQVAAAMGGVAFQKDLGAAHSLAHPLSSLCGLHHGLANALCLPVVMEFNAARRPGLYARVGEAMNLGRVSDAQVIAAVLSLLEGIGLTPGLRAQGVSDARLSALADQAFADSCHRTNPVPVTRDDLFHLYERAM